MAWVWMGGWMEVGREVQWLNGSMAVGGWTDRGLIDRRETEVEVERS